MFFRDTFAMHLYTDASHESTNGNAATDRMFVRFTLSVFGDTAAQQQRGSPLL